MSALLFALLVPEPAGGSRSARRDRLADAIAIGLACGYGALMVPLGDATAPGAALPWPVDVGIGTLCAFALAVRRRWPLGLALVLLPFGAVSVMATGAITVALFTVAIRCRARVVFLLGAVNVLTGVAYFLLQDHPTYPLWVDVVMRVVISVAAAGWGLFVQAYRGLTRSLREHASRVEADQHLRVEQARLTERARIAREMHDVLAHRMSLVSLHAGALEVRTDARPEEVALAAGAIRASAHEALQELRTVVGVLREGAAGRPEPPQPGLADLPDLVESGRATGMTIHYSCRVPPVGPSMVLGRTAYRFVQEGLTNARKHAPGAAVEVQVAGTAGEELRITITNPCAGPSGRPVIPGAGMGLVGLGERVALAGGRVEYGVDRDTFRLRAWLPWSA
ncbi:sensor histidine kinase [Micromonospora sp. NBC_01796]|uniref:sensor histidine kinase n=1 Tax=Micromonospora sp. NBC_01796 TaxID=2975987 RepID=UPI002DD8DCCF|nr:histidine kinase [Micromonospora sp. NBC_01796]WSA84227.1 histidine kinase [Micromonospora sp. NBC_01796]